MKEIFDSMREKIRSYSCDVDTFSSKVVKSLDTEDALEVINEAEAKWKEDCCEWKDHTNKHLNSQMTSCGKVDDDYKNSYKFCPYCGKSQDLCRHGRPDRFRLRCRCLAGDPRLRYGRCPFIRIVHRPRRRKRRHFREILRACC